LGRKGLIVTGHVKSASINKNGKDINAKDLALTGALKMIVCADMDAIGYLYRNQSGQTVLSFVNSETDLASGARPQHLSNKEFVMLDKSSGTFNNNWNQIYI